MNSLEPRPDPEPGMPGAPGPDPLDTAILRLAEERGLQKSFCPSEVARALSADWRSLLGPVRAAARRLAEDGRIDILRHGKPVAPALLKGVIRLRLRQDDAAAHS